MNRVYRLVFNRSRGLLMAVAEVTLSRGKAAGEGAVGSGARIKLAPLSALCAALTLSWGGAVLATNLPQGAQVTGGQVSIATPTTNQMVITQSSSRAAIDWNSFNIGAGSRVAVSQPSSSAMLLNRVVGLSGSSQILGTLTANGQVFIVNPQGVVFGNGSVVNAGAILASTRDINPAAFMAGGNALQLAGGSTGNGLIQNDGSLNAVGGWIVLAGDQVKNTGSVNAPASSVALLAGGNATLSLANGQLVDVQLAAGQGLETVESRGSIAAQGGRVWIAASSANQLLGSALNLSGLVDVSCASGVGGHAELTAQNVNLSAATVNASGASGGGTVLVGGGQHGAVMNLAADADTLTMDAGSVIDASATGSGNGGTVVLWSNNQTRFNGSIASHGGMLAGDGGAVEISGGQVQVNGGVSTTAPHGEFGSLLIDPDMLYVVNGSSNIAAIDASNGTYGIGDAWITSELNLAALTLAANYDIIWNANATVTANATSGGNNLYVQAGRNLDFEGKVLVSGQATQSGQGFQLLELDAGTNVTYGPSIVVNTTRTDAQMTINGTIDMGGGNFTTLNITNFMSNTTGYPAVGLSGDLKNLAWGFICGSTAGSEGVLITGNLTQVGSGVLTINGTSSSPYAGLALLGNLTQASVAGHLQLNGFASANNAYGVFVGTNASVLQTAGGMLNISGTSTASIGLYVDGSVVQGGAHPYGAGTINIVGSGVDGIVFDSSSSISQTNPGTLNVNGSSSLGSGAFLRGSLSQTGGGNIDIVGNSTATNTNYDNASGLTLGFYPMLLSSQGNLNISGHSNVGSGLYVLNETLAKTGAGTIRLSGSSNSSDAVSLNGSPITVTGGNMSIIGTSLSNVGVNIAIPSMLVSDGSVLYIGGTSGQTAGVALMQSIWISGAGQINVEGTSTSNFAGVYIGVPGNSSMIFVNQSGSGSLSITGSDANGVGVDLVNAGLFELDNGVLNISGTSTDGVGLSFYASGVTQQSSGSVQLQGNSTNSYGSELLGSNLEQTGNGGVMNLLGYSTNGTAVAFTSFSSIMQSGNSTLSISDSGAGQYGVSFANTSLTQSGSGTVNVNATTAAASAEAIWMNGSSLVQSGSGVINLEAQANAASGIYLANSNLTQSGLGTLNISAEVPSTFASVQLLNDNITQSGGGTVDIMGSSVALDQNTSIDYQGKMEITSGSDLVLVNQFIGNGRLGIASSGNLTLAGTALLNASGGMLLLGAGGYGVTGLSNGSDHAGDVIVSGHPQITVAPNVTLLVSTGNDNIQSLSAALSSPAAGSVEYLSYDTSLSTVQRVNGARNFAVRTLGNASLSNITATKVYDGTANAGGTLDLTHATIGIFGGQYGSAHSSGNTSTTTNWSGNFNTSHAGTATFNVTGAGNVDILVGSQVWEVNNLSVAMTNGPAVITPANLTVTTSNVEGYYGSATPALSYTVTGMVDGLSASQVVGGSPGLNTSVNGPGSYAITLGSLQSLDSDYVIQTYSPGTLTLRALPGVGTQSSPVLNGLSFMLNGNGFTSTDPGSNGMAMVAAHARGNGLAQLMFSSDQSEPQAVSIDTDALNLDALTSTQ